MIANTEKETESFPIEAKESKGGLKLEFEPKFSSLKQRSLKIGLEWTNITYTIKQKQILNGISGSAGVGEV